MHIPFYKPSITDAEIKEVVETLKGGWLTTGPRTKQFEKEFAAYLQHKHAIAVNSCTAALHLALEAICLKAGQSVVVPTMTFAATAEVVRYFGARPILVDCRTDDFNLDVADAELKIKAALAAGQSVIAIIPVHYGGQIGDVHGVRKLAAQYNLKIIEDAAHCCPAYYRDHGLEDYRTTDYGTTGLGAQDPPVRSPVVSGPVVSGPSPWLPVGTSADISCYSFYANKTITTGEGGMVCTANNEYADRMRIMSLHGISRDAWKRFTAEGSWYYEIIAPGFKYNLTDIASAIGLHQVRRAKQLHARRTELAEAYAEALGDVEELLLPRQQPNRIHSWHLYPIRLKLERLQIDRAQFITEVQRRGIGVSVHWMPLHMHPYYRQNFGYVPQDLPVAASLYPQLVSLPLYPDMTEDEHAYVCASIKQSIASNLRADVTVNRRIREKEVLTQMDEQSLTPALSHQNGRGSNAPSISCDGE
jgi:perosamine synthetase